jgi:hypothetical protein
MQQNIQQYREQILQKTYAVMTNAVDSEKIQEDEVSEMANFILDRVDHLETYDQVIGFFHLLSLKWPIFSPLSLETEGKLQQQVETHVRNNMLSLIKEGKVSEAVQIGQSLHK